MWVNGPLPWSSRGKDTAHKKLVGALNPGEKALSGRDYLDGHPNFITPLDFDTLTTCMHDMVLLRHELTHGLIKQYHILSDNFCHDATKHGAVFAAIANIVQISIETDEPLLEVEYNDNVPNH